MFFFAGAGRTLCTPMYQIPGECRDDRGSIASVRCQVITFSGFPCQKPRGWLVERKDTLPETNIVPKNGWLEYDPFLLGRPIFRGEHVSFREGKTCHVHSLSRDVISRARMLKTW